jgi:hypothetical protein
MNRRIGIRLGRLAVPVFLSVSSRRKLPSRWRRVGVALAVLAVAGGWSVVRLGPVQAATVGRMTGSGGIYDSAASAVRVRYTFELHCDVTVPPNPLNVDWDTGNAFQLSTLIAATCSDDPSVSGVASFDTYSGSGTGTVNGVTGATAQWTFTDAGDPGSGDTAHITISDAAGKVILTIAGPVVRGNHQAFDN